MSFKPLPLTKKDKLRKVVIEMDKDEDGQSIITDRFLKLICEENGQFSTPSLNETLYLHYKGFQKIQNLESYSNIKSIWLECNGITKIENLECLPKLKMIYLHQNGIKKIEGLQTLTGLITINLSCNMIQRIEGLEGLVNLKNIDLQQNLIPDTESCEELLKLPNLQSIDLKNNQISDSDNLVPFFSQMQQIHALYLKGNPCVRFISNYRKTLTQKLKSLNYLDDRPIFDHERMVADAFARGGAEEEKKCRDKMAQDKADKLKRTYEHGRIHTEEGKIKRKEALKRMLDELKDEKEDLVKKREGLKADYKAMPDSDPTKNILWSKIRKIEQDLQTEFFKLLEDRGEEPPSVVKAKAPDSDLIRKQYKELIDSEEKRI